MSITAKQLLLKQLSEAFSGRPDMPLMAVLKDITQDEASWSPDAATPNIEQLVRHVAWSTSFYCQEGFGREMVLIDTSVNENGDAPSVPWEYPCGAAWGVDALPGIAGAIKLFEQSHQVLTECLESCSDESLDQPIPNRHGKTAAHFFWIMIMHYIYHAGTIRTRRTMYCSLNK